MVLGGTGAALSVTRSLGRIGVPVHVLGTDSSSLARASRHCASFVAAESGDGLVECWLHWLETSGPRGAVLLPAADNGVELAVRHASHLESLGYRLLDYAGDVSLAMLDKARTYELAREVGVDCPQTWRVRDEGDLRDIAGELSYPCALKPLQSHLFARHFQKKVFLADDRAQLLEGFARARDAGVEVLVTEIIPGPDDSNWAYRTYIDERGQPAFGLTTNRLRSGPPHFGTNCYVVTRWNPEVAEMGLRFLQGVGLRGLAYTEIKRDTRNGRLKLIECNHRFGNAQEVVRRAGLDVAQFAYLRATGRQTPEMGHWREGVRLWFPLRDFRAARQYVREGELTWPQWAASLARPHVHTPALAFEDPAPTLHNASRKLRNAYRRRRSAAAALRMTPPSPVVESDVQPRLGSGDPRIPGRSPQSPRRASERLAATASAVSRPDCTSPDPLPLNGFVGW